MGLRLPRTLPYSAAEVIKKGHRDRTDYPQGLNSHRHNSMTWGQAVILCKLPCLCPARRPLLLYCWWQQRDKTVPGCLGRLHPKSGTCHSSRGPMSPHLASYHPNAQDLMGGICADVIARCRMWFMAECSLALPTLSHF